MLVIIIVIVNKYVESISLLVNVGVKFNIKSIVKGNIVFYEVVFQGVDGFKCIDVLLGLGVRINVVNDGG